LLTVFLMKRGTQAVQAQTRYYKAKTRHYRAKLSPWSQNLLDLLAPSQDAAKLPPLSSLPNHIGDPIRSTPLGSPFALIHSVAKTDDKTDK
jgi:hypothetical protein